MTTLGRAGRQKLKAEVIALQRELQTEREGREEEREGIMQEIARIKARHVFFRHQRVCCHSFGSFNPQKFVARGAARCL